ncbi:MAG: GDP-mannose 4,6-dehydratase, partial [Candidatus Nanohaloarchaea archaeon]
HPEYLPVDERHPKAPTSPYGVGKLTGDQYVRLYSDLYDLDAVALRFFNVYGPRQTGGDYAGVITVFLEQAMSGEALTIHGDGEQTRDFVHVSDVVQALAMAVAEGQSGEAYNIGTGEAVSINDLAGIIQEEAEEDVEPVHTDPRQGDIEQSRADISKAREELGFEPRVDIREGLRGLLE